MMFCFRNAVRRTERASSNTVSAAAVTVSCTATGRSTACHPQAPQSVLQPLHCDRDEPHFSQSDCLSARSNEAEVKDTADEKPGG